MSSYDDYTRGANGMPGNSDPGSQHAYQAGQDYRAAQTANAANPPLASSATANPVGVLGGAGPSAGSMSVGKLCRLFIEVVGWLPVTVLGALFGISQIKGALLAGLLGGGLMVLAARVFAAPARPPFRRAFNASFFAMLACYIGSALAAQFGMSGVSALGVGTLAYGAVTRLMFKDHFSGVWGFFRVAGLTLATVTAVITMLVAVGR